jgi:hypothetical protein
LIARAAAFTVSDAATQRRFKLAKPRDLNPISARYYKYIQAKAADVG